MPLQNVENTPAAYKISAGQSCKKIDLCIPNSPCAQSGNFNELMNYIILYYIILYIVSQNIKKQELNL